MRCSRYCDLSPRAPSKAEAVVPLAARSVEGWWLSAESPGGPALGCKGTTFLKVTSSSLGSPKTASMQKYKCIALSCQQKTTLQSHPSSRATCGIVCNVVMHHSPASLPGPASLTAPMLILRAFPNKLRVHQSVSEPAPQGTQYVTRGYLISVPRILRYITWVLNNMGFEIRQT